MAYTSQAAIQAEIPPPILIDALDDLGTGALDAPATANLNQVILNATNEVNRLIGQRYAGLIPDPPPSSIADAALVLAIAAIFRRRNQPLHQEMQDKYKKVLAWLEKVGKGEEHLDLTVPANQAAAAASTSPAPSRMTGITYTPPTNQTD